MNRKNKYMWTILLLLVFVPFAVQAASADSRKEAALDAYMRAVPVKNLIVSATKEMAAVMPAEKRQQFSDLMIKYADLTLLESVTRQNLSKHFTVEEIEAMTRFYSSKEGKSSLGKMGRYMADMMPSIQAIILTAHQKAQAEQQKPQ